MKRSKFFIPIFLFFFAVVVHADNVSISASVDKTAISLDDQILLQITVSGSVSSLPNPVIPDMSNFNLYSSGRSQSMSFVNGQMSSSVILRYTLVPKNVGKYTIRPITMTYDNKTYETEPIQVDILPAGNAPRQSAPASSSSQHQSGEPKKNLFMTASVDRNTAYVNEQVVYAFKFYVGTRLLANPQYSPPDFTGFWTEDTAPKQYYTSIDGKQYMVYEVKTLLFPTKPGKYNLGAASLQCSVEDFSQDPASDQFFSNFFSGGRTQVVHTNPISINVMPLPEQGKPSDFSGAVGQFEMKASLDKQSVRANEPVTLSIIISGTGNIKTVPDPILPDWPDFKKYETASSLNISKEGETLRGSKEFKTIIVPLTAGPKTIKPASFSFFDPKQKTYRTVSAGEFTIDVKPSAPGSSPDMSMLGSKREISVINSDIRYIKPVDAWETYGGCIYAKPWFAAVNIFPLCLLGLFFGYVKWREKLTGDVAFARRLRASATAKKFLKKAGALLVSGAAPVDYYNAVSRALLEFIANKTNVSADGLTTASISDILLEKKVTRETISKVSKILDECNLVRFAPTDVTQDMMKSVFAETEELIGRLEKEMR